MRSPESFDAFYASSRDHLLHETYALTGDLAAARTAVRDAFAVAWHHWRKVAILDDRETWMRPVAHGRARRRASTRLWHRDKSLDPEVRKTLAALSKLTGSQRQLLVLTTLSPLSMRQIARVVGLPRADAERELQTATTQFALHRDVPTVAIRGLLDDLAAPLAGVRWPRAPIVRRAGTARRRLHTAAGAALAAVVLAASGSLVTAGAGAEPSSLQSDRTTPSVSVVPTEQAPAADEPLEGTVLLDDAQVGRFGPRLQWARTGDPEDAAEAVVLPCQREPYAGLDQVLRRSWDGTTQKVERTRVPGTDKVRRKRVTPAPSCSPPAASAGSATRPCSSGCAHGAPSPAPSASRSRAPARSWSPRPYAPTGARWTTAPPWAGSPPRSTGCAAPRAPGPVPGGPPPRPPTRSPRGPGPAC
ncbi:MAG: hypothetical protein LT071_12350 [Nocardioides sp.]|nr:hypothetical protein [Nocardioides sp.]